jgi:hypothetical protein
MSTALKDVVGGFGTVAYDTLAFSVLRHVKLRSENIWDASERMIKYIRYTLNVQGVIANADVASQEAAMATIHAVLSRPGKPLQISGIGFDTPINTAPAVAGGSRPDVLFGAKPRVLACNPIGAELAWEIVWECDFFMAPRCTSQAPLPGAFLAFNYDVDYTTDEEGLVTRVIAGELEIYNTANGRKAAYNPELAFDRVTFGLPVFMRRLTTRRHFNAARNSCEFSIADAELVDDAYPDGIIEADLDEDFENTPPGFINWIGSLSGSMRVAPGYPKSLAMSTFLLILLDRAEKMNQIAAKSNGVVIPEGIRIGGQVFGRTSRFACSFRMVACLHDLLQTGLWTPVPGTSYASWQASMKAKGIFDPRGFRGLKWNLNDDLIMDICTDPGQIYIGNDTFKQSDAQGKPEGAFNCDKITKERSYLLFLNRIRGVVEQNALLHRIMQTFTGVVAGSDTGDGTSIPFPQSSQSQSQTKDHITQYASGPDNFIIMQGKALRLKFQPEIPRLTKVGGVDVEELSRNVETVPRTSYFHCTLFSSRWAILYRVKGPLYSIKPMNNRNICFTDGEDDGRK